MEEWESLFEQWQKENTLLNIQYIIPKKGRYSFSGRLLQYNPDNQTLLFYEDDKKSVVSLVLNQIEDISEGLI